MKNLRQEMVSAAYTLEQLAAQRWLEHLVIHCSRVAILLGGQ
ncbi:hypothetical protein [Acinetobacter haemolyticus]|nr:hypothetical protein [Acinetobacter haemolyticus]